MSYFDFIRGMSVGRPSAQAATVPSTTGPIYTATRLLGSSSTLALMAGSNANLSMNTSSGAISPTVAIAAGVSQVANIRETNGSLAVEYPVTLTGALTAPGAVTLSIAAGNGQNVITVTNGSTGGSPIIDYELWRGLSAGNEVLIGTVTLAGSTYTDTGLTNGVAYYYKFKARNAVNTGPFSNEVSGTPAAVAITFSSEPTANRVYQRTSATGGGYGKGQGQITVGLTLSAASPVYVKTVSAADGTTVVQAPFLASASMTTGNLTITGLDVPDVVSNPTTGKLLLAVGPTASGPWTLGTQPFMLGHQIALTYSQSHSEAMTYHTDSSPPTFASLGITVNPYAWTYVQNTQVTAALAWRQPAYGGIVDGAGVATLLNGKIAALGVACAVIGYQHGSTQMAAHVPGGTFASQVQSTLTATGNACAELIIMIGHNDSLAHVGVKGFASYLSCAYADFLSRNTNYSGTPKTTVYTIPNQYRGSGTIGWVTGRVVDCEKVRDGASLFVAGDPTNRTHIECYDLPLADGCHPLQVGAITIAQAMLRGASNRGPSISSVSRSGQTITVTVSHNLGTALVGTGSWWTRFLVTSADAAAGGKDWNSIFTVSGGSILNATQFTLQLATDPGNGHALSLRAYPTIETSSNPSGSMLRDNYDPEGYGYGRALERTGVTAVAVPLISGVTVNAPETGFVTPTSPFTLTPTSAAYTTVSGFGQELTGGYLAGTVLTSPNGAIFSFPWKDYTVEGWLDAAAPVGSNGILFSGGNGWIGVNNNKLVTSLGSLTPSSLAAFASTGRHHWAFVADGSGMRLYLDGLLAASNSTVPSGLLSSSPPNIRTYSSAGNFLYAGGVDEILISEVAKYTGTSAVSANFTVPTSPFAASPADAVAHWPLDGASTEVAIAA